ncbi:hypothetical protein BH20ACT8_BH20ACT8_11940 [soil metagenome]
MGNGHTNWKDLRRRRAIGETPESRRAYAEADRDQQLGDLVYRLRTEAQRLRVAPAVARTRTATVPRRPRPRRP